MVSKLTKKPENSSTGMAVTGPTKVATCQRNTILHHYINIRQNMNFLWHRNVLIMRQIVHIISSI